MNPYMQSCDIAFDVQAITSNFLQKTAMSLEIHLSLLLSFILASIPLSSSKYTSRYAIGADPTINLTCGSVPPLLSIYIAQKSYTIQEISLQGYIKIFAGPIHKRCIGATGKCRLSL
jgi:hypothetical protein